MADRLHDLLTRDHTRLDHLLETMIRIDGTIDDAAYAAFRGGLLRHIGIEERILFPEVRRLQGSSPLMEQLHRDHAVLAALLVPPPTGAEIEQIRAILLQHNPLEEEGGGFYEVVEELTGDALTSVLARVEAYPEVRLAPHSDTPILRRSIEQLLRDRK